MTELDTKRCVKCCVVQTIANFGPSKKTKDRLFPYCRECKRASDRVSNDRHRDERNAAAKVRYAANPEPGKAKSRERYRKDPAKWKAEVAAWAKANPEKRKVTYTAWQKRNLHGSVREATRRRYATRMGATAIRFSAVQLRQRMAYWGNRCWWCGGPQEEVDHVKPLTAGGAHMLCNLRPICKSCNSSKKAVWPVDTARRV